MSKDITLFGQDFSNVPSINVPLQGGGTARFIDEDDAGGGSWQTLFEGSVTTRDNEGIIEGAIDELTSLTADSIKVTFNGTEYTCDRNEDRDDVWYGDTNFIDYPFAITVTPDMIVGSMIKLVTETAGTYTLKIEEPQGGSSDFSTAEVTFNSEPAVFNAPNFASYSAEKGVSSLENFIDENTVYPVTLTVLLFNGKATSWWNDENAPTISGDITEENYFLTITGDCSITRVSN